MKRIASALRRWLFPTLQEKSLKGERFWRAQAHYYRRLSIEASAGSSQREFAQKAETCDRWAEYYRRLGEQDAGREDGNWENPA
jgi:hypothetical protein